MRLDMNNIANDINFIDEISRNLLRDFTWIGASDLKLSQWLPPFGSVVSFAT